MLQILDQIVTNVLLNEWLWTLPFYVIFTVIFFTLHTLLWRSKLNLWSKHYTHCLTMDCWVNTVEARHKRNWLWMGISRQSSFVILNYFWIFLYIADKFMTMYLWSIIEFYVENLDWLEHSFCMIAWLRLRQQICYLSVIFVVFNWA